MYPIGAGPEHLRSLGALVSNAENKAQMLCNNSSDELARTRTAADEQPENIEREGQFCQKIEKGVSSHAFYGMMIWNHVEKRRACGVFPATAQGSSLNFQGQQYWLNPR
jgi:hypothetical protein